MDSMLFKNKKQQSQETQKPVDTDTLKNSNQLYHQIPLNDEQKKMSKKEIMNQFNVSSPTASKIIERGFLFEKNKEYQPSDISKLRKLMRERVDLAEKYFSEKTTLNIYSVESLLNDPGSKKEITEKINEFKKHDRSVVKKFLSTESKEKQFLLSNGQEITIGDLILSNIFIENKIFRNKEGRLMMLDKTSGKIEPVWFESLLRKSPGLFHFRSIERETPTGTKKLLRSNFGFWEIISPTITSLGLLRPDDFPRTGTHSSAFDIFGSHERKLSPKTPYVYFSDKDRGSKYYLGREKFVGTNVKINHETVSVILLDRDHAAILDDVHGKQEILFTFPFLSKDEFQRKKQDYFNKINTENENGNDDEKEKRDYINHIVTSGEEMKSRIREYSITDYIRQKNGESIKQYAERIARLSDTGYVLGSFRTLMSAVGIGAHQFQWSDQLVIADALTNVRKKEIIVDFAKKFSIQGLRTFISLEHGGSDMGQKILDMGEQLPPETASKIFAKYSEIIDSVEKVLDVAQNNFKSAIDTKPELLQSIEQSLYKRGADLLSQFHSNINQNPDEIIAELERINADTITTLSIFKYAAKFGNKLPLEDISGAEFSKKSGNELSFEEISEMEHVYQVNWKDYGNQKLIQSVIQKFKESLTGDNAKSEQVYTFKKNDQINAFVKFSQLNPGVKYASALNVDQSSKGFGLGETMMDEALYREAQENILIATCDPYNDSNMRYFEKGFVGTDFTGDNPPVMNICWNESMNSHIQSKHISSEDLVIMYLKQQVPSNFIIKKGKTLQEIHTDIPAGKSLTRCFRDPLHTGDWYAVYETIPTEYETTIKTTD